MLPPSGHERDRRIRLILRAMGPRTTIGKTTLRIMRIKTIWLSTLSKPIN